MGVVVSGLALAMGLAGCNFIETRPGLDVAVQGKFDRAPARAAALLPTDWAKLFGSAELDGLARATEAGNLDVAGAAARILQADAQTAVTASALYPQLSSTSNTARTWTPSTIRQKRGPFDTSAGNTFQLGLTASYALDLWGKNRLATLAAAQTSVATRFDRDALVLSSVASTVNSYLNLLSAQDRLKIAANNLKDARDALEAIKGRLSVGTVTGLEVAEQQSVVDQQFATIPPLEQQLQQAKTAIALLTGRAPEGLKIRGGSLDGLKSPAVPAGIPAQLLLRRPDVGAAEAALFSTDASVLSARAAFLPNVTLTANGGLESVLLKTLLRPEAAFGSIAGGITQPLIDGGALQGQLDLARGQDLENLEAYRKAVVQSLVDVENALIAIAQNTEHERRLAAVVKSSQEAYDITRARLKEGTIDIITVLTAEQTLFGAQDALAVVRLARFTAIVSLIQALGGGWTHPVAVAIPQPSPFRLIPAEALAPDAPAALPRGPERRS